MKLAVIADLHFTLKKGLPGKRRGDLGELLLRRVVTRLNRFIRPDVTVLLGDIVDDGNDDATELFRRVARILDSLKSEVIVLPGNHDGDLAAFRQIFGLPPPALSVAGLRMVSFLDREEPGFNASRSAEDLARTRTATTGWPGPVVALQHVPVFTPGTTACPYNYSNAVEVLEAMRQGGISLALAGHCHDGLPMVWTDGVASMAVPALCEYPFQFAVLEFDANGLRETTTHQLAMPDGLPLSESHIHTEFAYCGNGVSIAAVQECCRLFNVPQVALLEHSGQLYFDRDTFWQAKFMPEGLDTDFGLESREDAYFAAMAAHGLPKALTGLEVDCDFQGRPVLKPRDRERVGYLYGAIHWIPQSAGKSPYDPESFADMHVELWRKFIPCGIHVLAHPFRIFSRYGVKPPRRLYPQLAELLARHRVAAELNYHIQEPEAEFTQICLEQGIRLALGTDAHETLEIAKFWPHLHLLRGLGVSSPADLDRVLWRPRLTP